PGFALFPSLALLFRRPPDPALFQGGWSSAVLKFRSRWIAVVSVVCLLGVTAAACSGTSAQDPAGGGGAGGRGGGRGGRGGGGGAQPVVVTKVSQRDVPVDLAAVGNVEAYASVSVRSQDTGQLQDAFFHEGDIVKKGDKLFAIDPRPLEATEQQAQANLVRDQ